MKRNYIFNKLLLLITLFIAFFSFGINSYSANFKYSDFNWEELLEQNKDFWTSTCEGKQDCVDRSLETKEKFYKRLYYLLAKFENKGYYIDDYYIIATVFYGLDPDSFSDPSDDKYNPYSIDEDESTKDKYLGDVDGEYERAREYFDSEKDSLKTLINNFIGYNTSCFGVSNITPSLDNKGNKYCANNLTLDGDNCIELLSTYNGTFFDSLGLSLFGNSNKEKCEQKVSESGYTKYTINVNKTKEVNVEFFYEFLRTSKYFDNKDHLQSYFDVVLQYSGYENMKEFYKAAEDNPDLLEKYGDEIVEARETIINGIKDVIRMYGDFSDVSKSFSNVCNSDSTYWWPIGGSDITESDGKKMAIGDPVSVEISSNFGKRDGDAIVSSDHRGLDIKGITGTTPVIAAANGTVVRGALGGTGSCVEGDTSCGGKFGNYVMILHTDGNYTVYAHMDTNSVLVNEGDNVSQGEIIGYVGSTGSSTGSHLHFEVRVGGNDPNSAQDPLNFINKDNPRGNSSCGSMDQLSEWVANMEGGHNNMCDDNHYKVVNIGDGVRTFGAGITVENNGDVIRQFGLNLGSLTLGSCVEVGVADQIYQVVIKNHMENMKQRCSSNGITGLNDNQLAALTSLAFNGIEPFSNFVNAYKKYGSTESLCTSWWHNYHLHDAKGTYYPGLAKRRKAECDLFVNGNYNMNVYD